MSRYIQAFLETQTVERGTARNTCAAYATDLEDLRAFAEERGEALQAITAETLSAYVRAQHGLMSPRTTARRPGADRARQGRQGTHDTAVRRGAQGCGASAGRQRAWLAVSCRDKRHPMSRPSFALLLKQSRPGSTLRVPGQHHAAAATARCMGRKVGR